VLLELTRPISFGRWRTDGEFLGIEKSVAVTDGDGSQMLRGRMGMDTTSAVTDGDGLIFHYRAGLYLEPRFAGSP